MLSCVSGNRDFGEVKELAAPDVVKCMAWCGDSLCLGIKREYVMMNISTGASFDVFPCGRIAAPLAIPLPNGEILLGKVCLSFSQAKHVWVISPYRNLHWWKERHM